MMPSFLRGLHASFAAPRRLVAELAERVTGRRVVASERIVRGYANEVHRIELADHPTVYVRIRRPDETESDYPGEVTAMSWALAAGVPAPDVLALERIDNRDAMVVAAARGRQLSALLPGLSPGDRRRVLESVGRTLDRIHSVSTPGSWRPDHTGRWPDREEVRRGFLADRAAERAHLERTDLDADEVEETLAVLGTSGHTPATGVAPVLCHGDLLPEHIFVDADLEVSDLIDWGMWHGGSPIGELAYLATRYSANDFATVVTGHGRWDPDDPTFREEIHRSAVNLLIGHIAHHVTIGDDRGAAENVAALRYSLDQLRDLAARRRTH